MKRFSKEWNKSKKPGKQHKFRYNAPLHIRSKFMSVHLSKDLRTNHKKRNITARKGDTVKVLRGQFKGKSGKIDKINLKTGKIMIQGIESAKKDGTKSQYPFQPSNLMITELNIDDKKRKKSLERKK